MEINLPFELKLIILDYYKLGLRKRKFKGLQRKLFYQLVTTPRRSIWHIGGTKKEYTFKIDNLEICTRYLNNRLISIVYYYKDMIVFYLLYE
jgi:hypothetical protein